MKKDSKFTQTPELLFPFGESISIPANAHFPQDDVEIRSGANFINILRAAFTYVGFTHSFFVLTF